jgi:hypothetical protein
MLKDIKQRGRQPAPASQHAAIEPSNFLPWAPVFRTR